MNASFTGVLGPRPGEEPTEKQRLGNSVIDPIVPDGRTGYDQFGQLMTWTEPDAAGYRRGWQIRDVRECACAICNQGWDLTSERLQDQAFVDHGKKPVHRTCLQGVHELNEMWLWDRLMQNLGDFTPYHVEEGEVRYLHSTRSRTITILNYDKERTPSPVKLLVYRRKRVWELRIYGLGDLREHFVDFRAGKGSTINYQTTRGFEDATEDSEAYYYIHAWEEEQALEILKVFKARWEASGLVTPYVREA